jgi:hypothetical protein
MAQLAPLRPSAALGVLVRAAAQQPGGQARREQLAAVAVAGADRAVLPRPLAALAALVVLPKLS